MGCVPVHDSASMKSERKCVKKPNMIVCDSDKFDTKSNSDENMLVFLKGNIQSSKKSEECILKKA